MDDLTEDLAELDHQIDELERLATIATECAFWELARLLNKDVAEARLWRTVFAAKLHSPAQEEAPQ